MKIKSLLLGSVAAAGLSTGAFAADLNVLTSLDVCDSLGISGLTISSDSNCLQISGDVSYRFLVGNFQGSEVQATNIATGNVSAPFVVGGANSGIPYLLQDANGGGDWESMVIANLKFVATASSDFGPAMAVININETHNVRYRNNVVSTSTTDTTFGLTANGINISEAYVSVGDQTVLTAGRTGTVFNHGDDTPYNYLGLVGANWSPVANAFGATVNGGRVLSPGVQFNDSVTGTDIRFGGDVIQLTTTFGDGFYGALGLENISDTAAGSALANFARAGTAVGVIGYRGDMVTAHLSGAAGGVLDGVVEWWAMHAGAELTIDNFKLKGALAANNGGWWNGLISGQATFDMFTIALSAEADSDNEIGLGGSIAADVTDTIRIQLGANWFDTNTTVANDEQIQVALNVTAAVTETITVGGTVGAYFTGAATGNPAGVADTTPYVAANVAWAPGGGFTTSLGGQVTFTDATPGYQVAYRASKSFK